LKQNYGEGVVGQNADARLEPSAAGEPGMATGGASSAPATLASEVISVRGARVHNLRNLDCEIPLDKLTVVTGVSGSGKSSLAFDTLYAEGERRYIESLSAYARQFLERMEKPDVDQIEGIAPAIAIRQKNTTRNPRSIVATATEIYDYLRLLFARIGITVCPRCGGEVGKDHIDSVAARVASLESGQRFCVLFKIGDESPKRDSQKPWLDPGARLQGPRHPPAIFDPSQDAGQRVSADPRRDGLRSRLEALRGRGFNRLYQDGRVFEFSTPESLLDVDFSRPVYALVDRLSVQPDVRQRLIDSVELCYREVGEAILEFLPSVAGQPAEQLVFSERFECKRCRLTFQEPEPSLFSFNSPAGACPRCQGFGNTIDFDLDRVIPDKGKSLAEGAVEPWSKPRYRTLLNELKRAARAARVPLDIPYHRLTAEQKRWVIEGDEAFGGVRGFFRHLERKKYKLHVRVFLSRYRGYTLCPECRGGRLRCEALNVRVQGKSIVEVCRLSILEAYSFFNALKLTASQKTIADNVLDEIRARLKFLYRVGLEYLTLDRLSSTLSGGEAQRIQLATALGSNLVGTLYVLDEPSIGLHPRDTGRLIDTLKNLRDLGNTILVVEHDPEIIRNADTILDLGPGAGEHGGQLVYAGDLNGLVKDPRSLTGRYLAGELEVAVPADRRAPGTKWLRIRGARQHNLKGIDAQIPLGLMVCISGVSGSGKSSLVHDVLYNTLLARRGVAAPRAECDGVEGDEALANVILMDQSPLGRTPRSNPLTYVKAFEGIRDLFASTPESRKRGYTPGHFSFNIPGGRCETCQGDGTVTVEMQFLADVELVCEDCRGMRFKPGILEIRYKGKNIHDVLQMTVHEALAFFAGFQGVSSKLRILDEVGLGYLRLGQSATTLSGGEAQRVRLAAHLSQPASEGSLFIFDEPTTGLHFEDINKLLAAFRKLNAVGATVLIIEHNLDVLKTADWIIDLGPEGGDAGGYVVAAGRPEDLIRSPRSYTGRFLAKCLPQSRKTTQRDPGAGHPSRPARRETRKQI
jgi:excinuclease ABC subunit A